MSKAIYDIVNELEAIINEFGRSDEYLQGVEALIALYYRRSMLSSKFIKHLDKELLYHYENIAENAAIEEIEVQPPYKKRTLEWQ